jgi:MFS family permease
VVGLAVAAWAPLIPLVKAKLGLDEGGLGGLLLCLGLGSVVGMPLAGGLAARFGCRRMILVSGTVSCIALPIMAVAPSAAVLAAALSAFGAGIGCTDVVMNIQAVIVEKASGRAMMSGFHGLYSVGGIAGAGAVTGLIACGLSAPVSALAIAVLAAVLLVAIAKGLLPYGGENGSPVFAVPRGRVLLLGILCFILFLAEGSVLDWSGVLLNVVRGLERSRAGLAYVAFSITMTAGRLTGDAIVHALGPKRIIFLGGLCAASGFVLAALVPAWPVSVLGFALVGVGAANVVPVLFSAAGRQQSMPSNLALAAVTTMGYAGVLAGPPLIGFVARASSLPVALVMVAAMLVAVVLSSRRATSNELPDA